MKVSCSSWSFRKYISSGHMDLEEFIKIISKLKIRGVELLESHFGKVTAEYIAHLKSVADSVNEKVVAVALENDFAQIKDKQRELEVEHVKRWIKLANLTKIPYLRVFTGNQKQGIERHIQNKWVCECFKKCAEVLERTEVYLGIENHGKQALYSTADQLLELLENVGSKHVKLCLDPYNFIWQGENILYESTKRLIPYALHTHLLVNEFDKEGYPTNLDLKRLIKIYKASNYQGYISIEYFGDKDPYQATKKASEILNRILEKN